MIKRSLAILSILVLALTACAPDAPETSGMVIVNARVIDGSGGPSREVNVRVVGDRIANVGDFELSAEDNLVDADGLVLAPGFIDTHSHHDDGLVEMPGALAAVSQGITTIVAGQDGGQNFPLAEFFASLETSPAEIANIRGSDPETTLMELLKADMAMGGEEAGSQMLGFAMDEPDIESIMAWPHTVIGSDGDLAGVHPRGFGAFTRFLGHYIRERNVISLEEGIRRMTSLSAQHLGIAERGSIRVGHYADLVLFDPETVKDRSTPEAPHVSSAGIEKVWVNGQLVIEGGQTTGNRPGKPIRRASP
jgi:N-acyl-D-aspartate/D-glutamate deacylase